MTKPGCTTCAKGRIRGGFAMRSKMKSFRPKLLSWSRIARSRRIAVARASKIWWSGVTRLPPSKAPAEFALAIAAHDRQDFACDVARAGGSRHEHKSRCDLFRLSRALHCRLAAEFRHMLRRSIGGVERRPQGAGRDRVDANAAIDQLRRKRSGECVYAAFGHRIVEHMLAAFDPGHGTGHHDCAPRLHVRHCRLHHVKIAIKVGLDGLVEVLLGELFEPLGVLLKGRVADQNIELPELS